MNMLVAITIHKKFFGPFPSLAALQASQTRSRLPAELVSVRLQTQNHQSSGASRMSKLETRYSGPIDCVKQIVRAHGIRFEVFSQDSGRQ